MVAQPDRVTPLRPTEPNEAELGMRLITLDKPRTLIIDSYALMRYEQNTGDKHYQKMLQPGLTDMLTLLWCGLLHEDHTLTLEQVAKMVPLRRTKEIATLVGEAFAEAWGPAEQKEDTEGNPEAADTSRENLPGENVGP